MLIPQKNPKQVKEERKKQRRNVHETRTRAIKSSISWNRRNLVTSPKTADANAQK